MITGRTLAATITDYINFCLENTVPTRKVQCFSNNKPWITPDIKVGEEEGF